VYWLRFDQLEPGDELLLDTGYGTFLPGYRHPGWTRPTGPCWPTPRPPADADHLLAPVGGPAGALTAGDLHRLTRPALVLRLRTPQPRRDHDASACSVGDDPEHLSSRGLDVKVWSVGM